MSWGVELWDKYGELTTHTQCGIDFLESYAGNFIKERAKIEADYAKSLRNLIKRYSLKESQRPAKDEYSHKRAYKQVISPIIS
jgi:formin-binding protein 1